MSPTPYFCSAIGCFFTRIEKLLLSLPHYLALIIIGQYDRAQAYKYFCLKVVSKSYLDEQVPFTNVALNL